MLLVSLKKSAMPVIRNRNATESAWRTGACCLAILFQCVAAADASKARVKYLTRSQMLQMVPCKFEGISLKPRGAINGEIKQNGVISITVRPRHFFVVLRLRGKWWLTEDGMVCRQYEGWRKECRFVSKAGETYTFHDSVGQAVSHITCR
ncbi:MAG TPA: hypothetical protein VK862_02565 [Afifellaceae bacterium]|nr:hypothetical protein [Afifellaceae bacterium]